MPSPVHTAVLLHERFSRSGPTHWAVKEVVAQRRLRLCQPSPQLTEHELHGDHSSGVASRSLTNPRMSSHRCRLLGSLLFPPILFTNVAGLGCDSAVVGIVRVVSLQANDAAWALVPASLFA